MRLLYVDVDTLRADHLGCYGYHRATSPNVDALAADAVRFEGCYASDVPCLPSRTALLSGRFGTRTGVVGQGGSAADPGSDGATRGFNSLLARTSWFRQLERVGMRTASVSSFAQRHSAFHWHAGIRESHSVGKRGLETADEVFAIADDWLARNGTGDHWVLHVHFWDPHTPYRVPESEGDPFASAPPPGWLTEAVRAEHWQGAGPHSARETVGFSTDYPWGDYPRQPRMCDSMQAVRRMFDGYDAGVWYVDRFVGRLFDRLRGLGVWDDTAVMLTADHGETLGELNVYCDHHTADQHVARVPMVLRWPGLGAAGRGRVDRALHYQFDVTATLLDLLGAEVPAAWDGRSFAGTLRAGQDEGREHLVLTQGAWTCQRGVRFEDYHFLHTSHDGYHGYPEHMLFDVRRDPHEQRDLAAAEPALVRRALGLLAVWRAEVLGDEGASGRGVDPLDLVRAEGGPYHVRGELPAYLARLRATGRAQWAERLAAAHPEAARE